MRKGVSTLDRNAKIVKLKLDIIFKRIFGDENNKDIIISFVSSLLEIPQSSIQSVTINNVELAPEYLDQKFSRLDLKMVIDNRIVNIEMQVNSEPDCKDRTLYYWSRIYSDELHSGDEYAELKQTICINIINFDLFDSKEYHSHFVISEKNRGEILTDKFSIHFFELKKIKNASSDNKPMKEWLRLINAETEGDLMDIQKETKIPEVHQTIVKLRELSADDKLRQEVYYREKRLHDEASALNNARREGIEQGRVEGIEQGRVEGIELGRVEGIELGKAEQMDSIIRNMRKNGLTEDQIRKYIGGE